jgi:chitobiase/beta-hexosaminidase-like protein
MKRMHIPSLIALAAALAACGGTDFEWFPKVTDSTPPTITATISGSTFQNTSSTTVHTSALPASVTFSATEPATIYYTTNNTDPTTSSASVEFSSAPVSGPTISVTNTILKFFGIDKSENKNKSATRSITIISP